QSEVNELLTFVDNVLSYIPQKEQVSLEEDVEVIYTRPFKVCRHKRISCVE
ncbi:unnamed protein product, partial [marine sediment metagenome]